MCQSNIERSPRVRLFQCDHGTYHLSVNGVTLHLPACELALVGEAINTWARRHPQEVIPALDALQRHLDATEQ